MYASLPPDRLPPAGLPEPEGEGGQVRLLLPRPVYPAPCTALHSPLHCTAQCAHALPGRTTWRSTLNKNQLRNQLRKYIQVGEADQSSPGRPELAWLDSALHCTALQETPGVGAGVDRIVDQIVNPATIESEVGGLGRIWVEFPRRV